MRIGQFEVSLLVKETLVPEEIIDTETYAIVNAGDSYTVQVNIYPPFPCDFLRIGLFVDGVDVNYWKRVNFTTLSEEAHESLAPATVVFWGFAKSQNEMKSFVFAPPIASSSSSSSASDVHTSKAFGRIKVVIYKAAMTFGTYLNQTIDTSSSSNSQSTQMQVRPDTKFWTQPSVGTIAGDVLKNKEVFKPLEKWINSSSTPLITLEMEYHTRDMLEVLRQVGDDSRKRKTPSDEDELPGAARKNDTLGDGIEIVEVVKIVPILDLTEDEDSRKWKVAVIKPEFGGLF